MDMKYCDKVEIIIDSPVLLDEKTISLYQSLSNSNYNLFDIHDPFFTDICSTYTTENGTDVSLNDRQKELFIPKGNISLCQNGCSFKYYNITTKKAKCNCEPQFNITEIDFEKIKFSSNLIVNTFLITFKYSNIKVMKCFKFVIDSNTIFKNYGRIIMTFIIFLFLILTFTFIVKDRKNIDIFITSTVQNKLKGIKNEKTMIKNQLNSKKSNNKSNIKTKINIKPKSKEKKFLKTNKKIHSPIKKKINKRLIAKKEKIKSDNSKSKSNDACKTNLSSLSKLYRSKKNININIIPINSIINNNRIKKTNGRRKNKNKNKSPKINIQNNKKKNNYSNSQIFINLNDQEKNTLSYEKALIYDKRTYFQYYCSLLRKKQLILFTFLPANDYNLITIKITLFLLSFSLYFSINGLFFSDDSMHKVFKNNGSYNLKFRIPQLIYSTLISSVINILLKLLSLTEQNIIKLKNETKFIQMMKNSKNVKSQICTKHFVFFILSAFLLLFFWYFITCFCGVYINTQLILIKDSIISFGLSMIYPFPYNIIPGIFRISALRAQKKNKRCLYQFSGLLSII